MDSVKRAAEVLRRTESVLRELGSQAVTAGDYNAVVQITAWARTVGDLLKGSGAVAEHTQAASASIKQATELPPASKRATKPVLQKLYPRFFRRNNQLVRIAWSKSEKKEYQHKTSQSVLQSLTKAVTKVGADGRIFNTDELLPLTDSDSTEVPNYQAYVAIALIKHAGLIDQHGRKGYSVPKPSEFKDAVEALWKQLPVE